MPVMQAALAADTGALNREPAGLPWILNGIAHHLGNRAVGQVNDAIQQVRTAGVPWIQIFSTLLPLVLSLFSGGTIDLAAIITAILALIPKTP